MKAFALILVLAGAAASQTPDVAAIMAKVAENQARSQEARKEFDYHQKQFLRMLRGSGKLAREERREYDVGPTPGGTHKDLAHFEGTYEYKGKLVPYYRPGYEYKEMDIDGELINDLSEDMTNDKHSRDGLACDLFPLTAEQQHRYIFQLKGAEQYRGREVYRVSFEPKPHQDFDDAAWKGEALIDAAEFQPVFVQTRLAFRIPMAVKVLLGTNITGLGFAVTYQRFEDGIWFPVSYGGEFEVRAVFFYKRKISVAMTNQNFRRTHVESSVTYVSQDR
ncbi:MAG TPA: hypothetical protein VMJ75_01125 [Candidatus Acidoferrales bacterium]|nr:hypothetical protein [Candidatus Acidoferrales bacterium]